MDQPAAYQQPVIEPQDRLSINKSIYQAGFGEIFAKNFLAGASRALGGIFLYVLFLLIGFNIFLTYAWPQVKPFIDEYRQAIESINKLNGMTTNPGTGPDTNQYQQFLRDLQESLPR